MAQKENKEQHRSEQEPLLYITQPQFPKVSMSMQQSFIIKPKVKKDEDVTEEVFQEKTEESLEQVSLQQAEYETVEDTDQVVLQQAEYAIVEDTNRVVLQQEENEAAEQDTEQVVLQQEEKNEPTEGDKEYALAPSAAIEAVEATDDYVETKAEQEEEREDVVRKSFKDLDTKQKIHYLLNRPHYIPRVLCEVKTQTGSHIGYVTSFENDVVILRSYSTFTTVKISYQDITDIQMRML